MVPRLNIISSTARTTFRAVLGMLCSWIVIRVRPIVLIVVHMPVTVIRNSTEDIRPIIMQTELVWTWDVALFTASSMQEVNRRTLNLMNRPNRLLVRNVPEMFVYTSRKAGRKTDIGALWCILLLLRLAEHIRMVSAISLVMASTTVSSWLVIKMTLHFPV